MQLLRIAAALAGLALLAGCTPAGQGSTASGPSFAGAIAPIATPLVLTYQPVGPAPFRSESVFVMRDRRSARFEHRINGSLAVAAEGPEHRAITIALASSVHTGADGTSSMAQPITYRLVSDLNGGARAADVLIDGHPLSREQVGDPQPVFDLLRGYVPNWPVAGVTTGTRVLLESKQGLSPGDAGGSRATGSVLGLGQAGGREVVVMTVEGSLQTTDGGGAMNVPFRGYALADAATGVLSRFEVAGNGGGTIVGEPINLQMRLTTLYEVVLR